MKIVTHRKKKLKSHRPLEEQEQLDNGFLIIEKDKWRIKLNKPSHAGASMQELSDVLKFDFHYNYIKSRQGNKTTLFFIDTISLMYETEDEDFYEDSTKAKKYLTSENI